MFSTSDDYKPTDQALDESQYEENAIISVQIFIQHKTVDTNLTYQTHLS